jgi:hypothetical protein
VGVRQYGSLTTGCVTTQQSCCAVQQWVPQHVSADEHVMPVHGSAMQWLLSHTGAFASQAWPHMPQLWGSAVVSTQTLPQHVVPSMPLLQGGLQVPPSEPPPPELLPLLEPLLEPLLDPLDPLLDPLLEPSLPLLLPLLDPSDPLLLPLLEPSTPLLLPLLEPSTPLLLPLLEPSDPLLLPPLDPSPPEPLDESTDAPRPPSVLVEPPQCEASATSETSPTSSGPFKEVRIAPSDEANPEVRRARCRCGYWSPPCATPHCVSLSSSFRIAGSIGSLAGASAR